MSEYTVLCVDDEGNILQALKRLLRKEDYTLRTAGSAAEGLDQLARAPAQVVVSDQRMPGMTGVEFLQKVKELYPDTVRVILSGYADAVTIVEAINKGEVFRFFAKPWNDEDLRVGIRQCLQHYELVGQNRRLLLQVREQNAELNRMNSNLDELVRERTRSLQLAQEILAILPAPVLGIGADGLIVMMNASVVRHFPSRAGLALGNDAAEALTSDELAIVQRCLAEGRVEEGNVRSPDRSGARLMAAPMKNADMVTGCVAMWTGGVRWQT